MCPSVYFAYKYYCCYLNLIVLLINNYIIYANENVINKNSSDCLAYANLNFRVRVHFRLINKLAYRARISLSVSTLRDRCAIQLSSAPAPNTPVFCEPPAKRAPWRHTTTNRVYTRLKRACIFTCLIKINK